MNKGPPQGIQGVAGNDGVDGKSAYEVWTTIAGNEGKSISESADALKGADGI